MTEPLKAVAPGFKSAIGVKHLYTEGVYELPWFHEKYQIHVDHFCGKNGCHSNQQSNVMNNYWFVAPHQATGLTGPRPTDAGTVVRLSTENADPDFIWSFLDQYRYGTLIRWKSRQYYVEKPTQQDEGCFHGLIDSDQQNAPDPFAEQANLIGFKYQANDQDFVWHIYLRRDGNTLDIPTTVDFEPCTWYVFKIIKDSHGNLFFYINDMRTPVLAVYADESAAYIPTRWFSEYHYVFGGQKSVIAVIDYSMIKCLNEPLVELCGR